MMKGVLEHKRGKISSSWQQHSSCQEVQKPKVSIKKDLDKFMERTQGKDGEGGMELEEETLCQGTTMLGYKIKYVDRCVLSTNYVQSTILHPEDSREHKTKLPAFVELQALTTSYCCCERLCTSCNQICEAAASS